MKQNRCKQNLTQGVDFTILLLLIHSTAWREEDKTDFTLHNCPCLATYANPHP